MKFVLALAGLAQIAAQPTFLTSPVLLWTSFVSPVDIGNECAVAPLNPLLVCSGSDGRVTALPLTPNTTNVAASWTYAAPAGSSGTSGITFSSSGSSFVYSSTGVENGIPTCIVHHVSVSGTPIWTSEALAGACSGTPVISSDDKYVYLTHNGASSGTFTMLDAADGKSVYNESDATQLLSPPGIYFRPLQGNYAGGIGNSNDIVMFANRPLANAVEVPEYNPVYLFQLPIGSSTDSLALVKILNETDFQTTTAPLITNGGFSMFWGVSRSKVVAWENIAFDRDPGGNNIGFDRGEPSSLPVLADLAIGSETENPTIYTGNAGPGFAAISTTAENMLPLWSVNTTLPVYAQAKVVPSDSGDVVFFIDGSGVVSAYDASGEMLWVNATERTIVGNFALSIAGDTMYFGDKDGTVSAWQIAEFADNPPTFAPVTTPEGANSSAPVATPGGANSSAPIPSNSSLAPVEPPITGSASPTVAPLQAGNSIYDVIVANPNVTILSTMLSTLNLTETLTSSIFTVFAPYDSAFTNALTESYLNSLLNDPTWVHHLTCLVFEHAIPEFVITSAKWTEGLQVSNLNAANVTLGVSPVSVESIPLDVPDIVVDNGVVHFIADTILPDCVVNDMADVALSTSSFSTLFGLVESAGLSKALTFNATGSSPLMLFGPSNSAFKKLSDEANEYLTDPNNLEDLKNLLYYHLVRNITYLDPDGGYGAGEFMSTDEFPLEVAFADGMWSVNNASISIPNVLVKNGIIHGIDEVLIPPDSKIPTPVPATQAPTTGSSTRKPTQKPTLEPVVVTDAPVTDAPTTSEPTKAKPSQKPSTSSGFSAGMSALGVVAAVVGIWV